MSHQHPALGSLVNGSRSISAATGLIWFNLSRMCCYSESLRFGGDFAAEGDRFAAEGDRFAAEGDRFATGLSPVPCWELPVLATQPRRNGAHSLQVLAQPVVPEMDTGIRVGPGLG